MKNNCLITLIGVIQIPEPDCDNDNMVNVLILRINFMSCIFHYDRKALVESEIFMLKKKKGHRDVTMTTWCLV